MGNMKASKGHNSLTSYMDKKMTCHDPNLKDGVIQVRYYADILVAGKK